MRTSSYFTFQADKRMKIDSTVADSKTVEVFV